MALVHTPPESTLDSVKHNVDIMIDEVASLIGTPDDPDGRERAMRALDRASDWMNMSGVYMFARKTETYDSFTDGDQTLAAPADFGWPEDRPRVYDSGSGRIIRVLEWLDWDTFKREQNGDSGDRPGAPSFISLRSELDQTFHVSPAIEAARVGTIEIDYLARINKVSESEQMLMTPETRAAMIFGGEAFVMRLRHATRPRVWEPFWAHFTKAVTQAKATAWRYRQVVHSNAQPDEAGWVSPASFRGGTVWLAL